MSDLQVVVVPPKLSGYRPDPHDPRDILFSTFLTEGRAVTSTGPVVDLRPMCSPVENQLQVGSCVGNAVVGGLELLENLRHGKYVDLSRLFTYYNARAAIQETEQDAGSNIRDAMASLSALGVCEEVDWPYDPDKVLIRPSWSAYRKAFAHKIDKYYRITGTGQGRIDQIESALRSGAPVAFGADVYEPFFYYKSGPCAMPGGRLLGGHAMLIVGFDSDRRVLFVRNSWGKNWGVDGYCEMPYDYLDAANANDFWAMT